MFYHYVGIRVVRLCEYTKITGLYPLSRRTLWYVNYILIRLLKRIKLNSLFKDPTDDKARNRQVAYFGSFPLGCHKPCWFCWSGVLFFCFMNFHSHRYFFSCISFILICSSFPDFFRWILSSLIFNFSSLQIYAFKKHFSLSIALAIVPCFNMYYFFNDFLSICTIFIMQFKIFLMYHSTSYMFGKEFSSYILLLIFSLIALWSENTVSIFWFWDQFWHVCVYGGEVPSTAASDSLNPSWVSYNSAPFWHSLPGDSIRLHKLRVQSYKPRLLAILLTNWL